MRPAGWAGQLHAALPLDSATASLLAHVAQLMSAALFNGTVAAGTGWRRACPAREVVRRQRWMGGGAGIGRVKVAAESLQ